MGWAVHDEESSEHAAALFRATCADNQLDPKDLVFRSGNDRPMRGSTMLATLDQLGVRASFSRPGVGADNAFSEALFRTVKYRPDDPAPFDSLDQARAWVDVFVAWYNREHRHSALRFVTPDDHHHGRDVALLAARRGSGRALVGSASRAGRATTRDDTPRRGARRGGTG